MLQLGDLLVGEMAKVLGFGPGDKAYRKRLLAFGLTPGAALCIERMAPLGGPVQISVRGSSIALRRDEATALRLIRC